MNTTNEMVEKVNKSSAECAEFNKANAGAIAAGLMLALAPTDGRLKEEQRDLELAKRKAEQREAALVILRFLDVNAKIEFEYTDRFTATVKGVHIEIEGHGGCYGGVPKRWTMTMGRTHGRRGEGRKDVQLGASLQDALTSKRCTRIAQAFAELRSYRVATEQASIHKQALENDYKAFIANPGNKDLLGLILQTNYVPNYRPDNLEVIPAADLHSTKLRLNNETYTLLQWKQVVDLRAKQQAEMKALKVSFAAGN